MHRLFNSFDVVYYTLRLLGRREARAASMVCKAWKDVALDVLWEDVNCEIFLTIGSMVDGVFCLPFAVCVPLHNVLINWLNNR